MSSTAKGGAASPSRSRRPQSPTERICEAHFQRWLAKGLTGCGFAAAFASSNRILFGTFDDVALPHEIDTLFDAAAEAHLPAVIVFVEIRTEEQLLDQLASLATGERWKVSRETARGLTTDDLLLGIRWTTSVDGIASMPMGFWRPGRVATKIHNPELLHAKTLTVYR